MNLKCKLSSPLVKSFRRSRKQSKTERWNKNSLKHEKKWRNIINTYAGFEKKFYFVTNSFGSFSTATESAQYEADPFLLAQQGHGSRAFKSAKAFI